MTEDRKGLNLFLCWQCSALILIHRLGKLNASWLIQLLHVSTHHHTYTAGGQNTEKKQKKHKYAIPTCLQIYVDWLPLMHAPVSTLRPSRKGSFSPSCFLSIYCIKISTTVYTHTHTHTYTYTLSASIFSFSLSHLSLSLSLPFAFFVH